MAPLALSRWWVWNRPLHEPWSNKALAQFRDLYCHCSTNILLIKMKLIGFLLLLSGWGIVLAALRLLHGSPTFVFILLGVAVEILGFVLVARAHLPSPGENG
jgi:hypothetical protein